MLNRCAEWRNITVWWFGSHDWIISHFIYGMSSFPLTDISIHFSEGLVNHHPDQQTQTSKKDHLKVVRLPQDPDGSSDSPTSGCVSLMEPEFKLFASAFGTIASASGSRSCGGGVKGLNRCFRRNALPKKSEQEMGWWRFLVSKKTWPFWIWHRFLNHRNLFLSSSCSLVAG